MTNLENLVYELMTTSTGTNLCDSGGANGRHWQKNQQLTLEDFKAQPPATLEFYGDDYPELTISTFHKLTDGCLELDNLCDEFNSLECGQWDGDYYGTTSAQCGWLVEHGFSAEGDAFNTYNWESNLSQCLQGQAFNRDDEYGIEEKYLLLQIHQGADVRGGYTDAKLFKVSDYAEHYSALYENAVFSAENSDGEYISLDYCGEWINSDGRSATDEDFKPFAALAKSAPIVGDIISSY